MQRLPAKIDRERKLNKTANSFKKFLSAVLEVLLLPHSVSPYNNPMEEERSLSQLYLQSRKFRGVTSFTLIMKVEIEKREIIKRLGKQQKRQTDVRQMWARIGQPSLKKELSAWHPRSTGSVLELRKIRREVSEGSGKYGQGAGRGDCKSVLMKVE